MTHPRNRNITIKIEGTLYKQAMVELKKRGATIETFVQLQLRAMCKDKTIYRLKDRITFGKYSGSIIEDIVRCDPKYMTWLLENSRKPEQFHSEIQETLFEMIQLEDSQ